MTLREIICLSQKIRARSDMTGIAIIGNRCGGTWFQLKQTQQARVKNCKLYGGEKDKRKRIYISRNKKTKKEDIELNEIVHEYKVNNKNIDRNTAIEEDAKNKIAKPITSNETYNIEHKENNEKLDRNTVLEEKDANSIPRSITRHEISETSNVNHKENENRIDQSTVEEEEYTNSIAGSHEEIEPEVIIENEKFVKQKKKLNTKRYGGVY